MIVKYLCDFVLIILDLLGKVINLPHFPAGFYDAYDYILDIIDNGASLIGFFVPINTLYNCLDIVLIIMGLDYGYHVLMWLLKKIPAIGVH